MTPNRRFRMRIHVLKPSTSLLARIGRSALLALLLAAAAPAAAQTRADSAAADVATWLRGVDEGRYAESWAGLGTLARGMVDAGRFEATLRQARARFPGTVAARTVESADTMPQPPGTPAGEYARIVFSTSFSGGTTARETVVAMREDGAWRALAYGIVPAAPADYSAPADAPYTAEDVAITAPGGHTLAGTLTRPEDAAGPVAAVVLISGSGPQDRDGHMAPIPGYRPFRQMADSLGRRGIAVLRLDDRGVGGSGGASPEATTEDFAADVRAAVEWLRARPDVDPARIGLVGHSEGGIIAPLVAVADPRIAAVALLAAPSWSGARISDMQIRDVVAAQGMAGAALDSAVARAIAQRDSVAAGVPWMRWFLAHDPLPTARRLRAPVLVLQGATDRQVTAEQAEELAAAVRAGGNRDVAVRVFADVNHLLLPDADGTADVARYAGLADKRVPADVLGALADWLAERLASR